MTRKIILLDGGLGQEVTKRSDRETTPLWSLMVMQEQPEIVEGVHRDFLDAGAGVLTINTYTATPQRLARNGHPELFDTSHAVALEIATRVRDSMTNRRDCKIAGSLPPLAASYHAEEVPDFDECLESYRKIVTLQNPGVDLFIAETMSCISEARAACLAGLESGKPVWCAFTLEDSDAVRLRSTEPLAEALEALADLEIDGILLNCSTPEAIDAAMPTLLEFTAEKGRAAGAYANGFTNAAELKPGSTVAGMGVRTDLGPDAYADKAMAWVQQGASIIGGCCEVGPEHISVLHKRLTDEGFELVSAF